MSKEFKMVPVEPTEEMLIAGYATVHPDQLLVSAYQAMLAAAPVPPADEVEFPVAGQWREGAPPHPWDSEWFLAETTDGHYAVLRPLPEDFTYDFTTVDETYLMRHKIKRWAQLSDSDYVQPEAESVPPAGGEVEVLGYRYHHPDTNDFAPVLTNEKATEEDRGGWEETELVDRAHVTRLQADCEALTIMHGQAQVKWCAERDALKGEVEDWRGAHRRAMGINADVHVELTKARESLQELFSTMIEYFPQDNPSGHEAMMSRAGAALAHQSAPVCEHEWVDMRNARIESGELCRKCNAIRAGNQSAPAAKGERYECIGKGGEYELIGESTGAGMSKGQTLMVYRDVPSGRVFHREWMDWNNRMQVKP